jgi:tight adherence protein B
MVIFALVFQLIHKIYIKEKKLKFKEQSLDEFLEINRILIAELYSGKSLESAYKEILHNLSKDNINQYPIMYQNLTNWCEQFEVGRSIEEVLKTFAHQNEDEVMEQFVDMICVTKEHGGNLLEVIELTNRVLREKRQIKIDIGVMISEKKLEQKVLSLMPFGMLILMQLTAYEFISPLYESLSGRMMMTLALFVFISCYMWSNHMTRFDT